MSAYKVRAIPQVPDPINPGQTIAATNIPPDFEQPALARTIAENAAVGTNVGAPVAAGDLDGIDILTYSLGETNASSYAIDKATGQITVNGTINFEAGATNTVEVTAHDPWNIATTPVATVIIHNYRREREAGGGWSCRG